MQELLPIAERIAAVLKARGETVAVSESSTGGLVSAALLSVPGASAYFLGGAVVYTKKAREVLLDIPDAAFASLKGQKPLSEDFALVLARGLRAQFSSTWALAEIGAAGPAGSRYGDPAGTSCIALAGPAERTLIMETGRDERIGNMRAFSKAALEMLLQALG